MEKIASPITSDIVLKAVQVAPGATTKTICSKIDYILFGEKGSHKERIASPRRVLHILEKLKDEGKIEIEGRNSNYRTLRYWPIRRETQ